MLPVCFATLRIALSTSIDDPVPYFVFFLFMTICSIAAPLFSFLGSRNEICRRIATGFCFPVAMLYVVFSIMALYWMVSALVQDDFLSSMMGFYAFSGFKTNGPMAILAATSLGLCISGIREI